MRKFLRLIVATALAVGIVSVVGCGDTSSPPQGNANGQPDPGIPVSEAPEANGPGDQQSGSNETN